METLNRPFTVVQPFAIVTKAVNLLQHCNALAQYIVYDCFGVACTLYLIMWLQHLVRIA